MHALISLIEQLDAFSGPQGEAGTVADTKKCRKIDLGRGFSLLESLTVVAIIGIVSAMSFMVLTNIMPKIRADSARQFLVNELRQARESSIDQRRNFTVTFKNPNEIVTLRDEITSPPCAAPGPPWCTTTISDDFLPYSMVYTLPSSIGITADTPDNFGNTYPVTFGCTAFPCSITFQSDGSAKGNDGATISSGSIFIAVATGLNTTARAVTILGATGRIKGYSYASGAWY